MRWHAGFRHSEHMAFLEPEELRANLEAHGLREATVRPGMPGYFVYALK